MENYWLTNKTIVTW